MVFSHCIGIILSCFISLCMTYSKNRTRTVAVERSNSIFLFTSFQDKLWKLFSLSYIFLELQAGLLVHLSLSALHGRPGGLPSPGSSDLLGTAEA